MKKILLSLIENATEEGVTSILDEYKAQEGDAQFAADQLALETMLKKFDAIAKAKGKKFIDQVLTIIETGVEAA